MRRGMMCLWIGVALVAGPAWGQLELTLEQTGVSVSVSPGAEIVLLGSQVHVSNAVPVLSFYSDVLGDSDQDGLVSPDLSRELAWRSVWVAVDLSSGEISMGAPEGYSPEVRALPEDLRPGASSLRDHMELGYFLVVRPGEGAWLARARDGSSEDIDGENYRSVAVALDRFEGLGDPAPATLHSLKPGDTVAILDHQKHGVSMGLIDPGKGAGQ